jgi:hypothetical protein
MQNDGKSVEEIRKEILEVEEVRNQAMLKHDTAPLERMYADDIAWTNPSGDVLSKAQILADLQTGKQKRYSIIHDDIHRSVYGNTVVVTGRSTSELQY